MSKANPVLVKFIKETRKRGISDLDARAMMLKKNWPVQEVEKAFILLKPKFKLKNQICIFLNDEISEALEKRAKKNMFTVSEQVEDILRRSCSNKKKKALVDNIDDKFLGFFSRKKR